MKEYIILLIIVAIILNIIIKLNKLKLDREKITIYECGFQEFDSPRKKFYLKFYLVALIFLIFDLESLFVYPLSIYISNLTIWGFYLFIYFIFILILGLAFEIYNSILS